MDVSELESKLKTLRDQAVSELQAVDELEELIQVKNKYLGRNGNVGQLMSHIGQLPDEDKPRAGRISNQCKSRIEETYETRKSEIEEQKLAEKLESEAIDVTLPAKNWSGGDGHPLKQVEADLIDSLTDIGFEVAKGPEVETDFFNFEALNFPPDHPARDMQDTFNLEDGRLLRTHTSPVQIRTMMAYEPPIRIISPGRVYRCDDDVTHSPVFHQMEALLVDTDVSFAELKGTLYAFCRDVFGDETAIRFRPSYFPFTEPSAEVDIGCIMCDQSGCRVCSDTGWLEILGAGMVDPNVFDAVGIDSDTYQGYAFGLGVERIAMLKYGIDDIRLFYENDVRFLEQFS